MPDLKPLLDLGASGVFVAVLIWFTNKSQERADRQYQAMLDWNKQQAETAHATLASVLEALANVTEALKRVSAR